MTTSRLASRALRTDELAALAQRFAEDVRAGCYEIEADTSRRWHVRIHQDDTVDVWLITWTQTQRTELHDHGDSRGVFTVVEGTLTEETWDGAQLRERTVVSGQTVQFGSAYVHDVYNEAHEVAVSMHAYSPPLTQMSYYDVEDGQLTRLATTWTDDPEAPAPTFASVDELLAAARRGLPRFTPVEAAQAIADGALMVDIRPEWQRVRDGEVPGSVIIERNHLEWRLHPASEARIEQAAPGQRWVVICAEGYTSSLAAASLMSLGVPAADVIGGIVAWTEAGLPIVEGATAVEHVVRRSA